MIPADRRANPSDEPLPAMPFTTDELGRLAREGASLDLDASRYGASELASLARELQPGGLLVLRGAARFTVADLAMVVRSGPPGSVVLVVAG